MIKRLRETFRPDSSYKAFFVTIVTFALAHGLYKGIIDNYLAESVGMSAFDKGVSEFFREMPGLALIFVLALLYEFSAERIYQIGALVMLAGMAMQAVIPPSKVLVIMAIFIYSLGEHIQLGMRNTISLASMASNVYVQDLADNADEVRATISTGVSVNHFITILVALFGGWIWKVLGIETLFMLSAVLGLCNSAYAATIKTRGQTTN